MIKDFKHNGLKKFLPTGSTAGIQAKHKQKLRMQLAMLDVAEIVRDLDKPGWDLHQLRGDRSSIWSIKVSGNWWLIFLFEDGDASIVNYEDYH